MMSGQTPVRIVIPAYDAMETLPVCLKALIPSVSDSKTEIVIVDDGKNSSIDRFALDPSIKILRSGARSAAVARNMGASDFKTGILVFIDADVVVTPGTVNALIDPIRRRAAVASVGNYSMRTEGLPFASKYKQLYIASTYSGRSGEISNDFWTALGAIDAERFHMVGGFEAGFSGAGGEDTDLGIRLTGAGCSIVGVPEAIGEHLHILSTRGLIYNDWRKGSAALCSHSQNAVPLRHNSHADGKSVFAAILAVLLITFSILPPVNSPVNLTAIIISYLFCRFGLLRVFAREGFWFLLRSTMIMFILDLVRAACVAKFVFVQVEEIFSKDRRLVSHVDAAR